MNPRWWILIGLAAWLVAGLAVGLVAGPFIWRRKQALLAPDPRAGVKPGQAHGPPPHGYWPGRSSHRRVGATSGLPGIGPRREPGQESPWGSGRDFQGSSRPRRLGRVRDMPGWRSVWYRPRHEPGV